MVIPLAVVEELDQQKKREDKVGHNARAVSRELDVLRLFGSLSQEVATARDGNLRVEFNHRQVAATSFPEVLGLGKMDNRILSVAFNLKQLGDGPVILVTKDLNIRAKADVVGIAAEDYRNDKVDYDALCSGLRNIILEPGEVDYFYKEGRLRIGACRRLLPNQFVVIRCRERASVSALARHDDGLLLPLTMGEGDCMGLKPRNKE